MPYQYPRAEIIAIGDELIGGVRVDTNSQWISQQLDQLGIQTAFHSTVGDDIEDMLQVFQTAIGRADMIVTTGGLGPTADDLTRKAIAQTAGVELVLDNAVLEHVQQMYHRRGRVMPPNNEIQAWFPEGSVIIDNPEGTAPGIEFCGQSTHQTTAKAYRIFSLPGVPAELKQMWRATVESRIRNHYNIDAVTIHHTLHCFGTGESAIEMQLPDLMERGRDPLIGITASAATISLRIATRGADEADCQRKIAPTVSLIRERLGKLVYGENGQQLEDVVARQLTANQQKVAVFDWGLQGEVARRLALAAGDSGRCLTASRAYSDDVQPQAFQVDQKIDLIIADDQWHENATSVLVVGPIDRDEDTVKAGDSHYDVGFAWQTPAGWERETFQFRFSGHSAWRDIRAVKDVLNAIRLLQ
jgi:nicotinamide-nucleotide amidase